MLKIVKFIVGLAALIVSTSSLAGAEKNWHVSLLVPFEQLDRYQGSSLTPGVGADLSYDFDYFTLHTLVVKSGDIDALHRSNETLGYSDTVVIADYTSYGFAASKKFELAKNWHITGTVGVVRTKYNIKSSIGEQSQKVSDSETPVFVGVGITYYVNPNLSFSTEINTGYSEIVKTGVLQLKASYHF